MGTKVVALLRVSTPDQQLGLDAQRHAIEAYAAAHGIDVLAWHTEIVSGGKTLEARPILRAAIADVIANGCSALLVAKRDRLSRDPLTALLAEKAIGPARVLAADSQNGVDPAAKLLRGILDAVAGFERSMIGVRTKAALARLAASGVRLGRPPGSKNKSPYVAGHAPTGRPKDSKGKAPRSDKGEPRTRLKIV